MHPSSFLFLNSPEILDSDSLSFSAKYVSRLLLSSLCLAFWSATIFSKCALVAIDNMFLALFVGVTAAVYGCAAHRIKFPSKRLSKIIRPWWQTSGFIADFAGILIATPKVSPSAQATICGHLADLAVALGFTVVDEQSGLSTNNRSCEQSLSSSPAKPHAELQHAHRVISMLLAPLRVFKPALLFLGHAFPSSEDSEGLDETTVPRQAWIDLYMLILRMKRLNDIDETTAASLLLSLDMLKAHLESIPRLTDASYPYVIPLWISIIIYSYALLPFGLLIWGWFCVPGTLCFSMALMGGMMIGDIHDDAIDRCFKRCTFGAVEFQNSFNTPA